MLALDAVALRGSRQVIQDVSFSASAGELLASWAPRLW
jgi:hypothetical protein